MSDPLAVARSVLVGEPAWLVGGAVRDGLLGRKTSDLDIVVMGDVAAVARAIATGSRRTGTRAACFALSREFGAWRVVASEQGWQIDVQPLQGGSLEEDLRMRDFTVNAIAQPLGGGELVDPLGGVEDLAAGLLRATGERAFADDPLRVLRLARIAVELRLAPVGETVAMAGRRSQGLEGVSGERVFAELRRIVASDRAREGLELADRLGATAVVLPELAALRGVQQSRYHHLDVHSHTIEVLEGVIALAEDPSAILGRQDTVAGVRSVLGEGLADGMTRGEALRWGALLHDAAKPATRAVSEDGRVTFMGHDRLGAQLAEAVLARLRCSTRLRGHVGRLVAHHLRLGFLVHEPQPLDRRTVFDYLDVCGPVAVDVTLLSIADRLATRGDRAEEAIAAHMRVARDLLGDALRWHREGPPRAIVGGDDLTRELGIAPGPEVGRLLEELSRARYAGEILTREDALAHAARIAG